MYAILRSKKLKSIGNAAASFTHNFREQETLNANPELTPDNEHLYAGSRSEAMGKLREKLPEKRRKDAVVGVEYLLTASPEWFEKATQTEQETFFNLSLSWLANKYGEENIITASVHRDEKTPHLSAVVVPLTSDGRLSAKEMIGNQKLMKDDQTSFAALVGNPLGLKRGIEGSKAKHQTIQKYYSKLNQAMTPIHITEQSVKPRKAFLGMGGERYADVAKILSTEITEKMQVYSAKAMAYDDTLKRCEGLQKSLDSIIWKNNDNLNELKKAHKAEVELYKNKVVTSLKDIELVTGLKRIPDEDKHFFKNISLSAFIKPLNDIYVKYKMNADCLPGKDKDRDTKTNDYLHALFARNVINFFYKKSFSEIKSQVESLKYFIKGAGTFPLPKDTPIAVLLENPHQAERIKQEKGSIKSNGMRL